MKNFDEICEGFLDNTKGYFDYVNHIAICGLYDTQSGDVQIIKF